MVLRLLRCTWLIRVRWLVAGTAAFADRALTFGYFIPTMVGLLRAGDDAGSVAVASRWVEMNHVRHALVAVAWVTALGAFARLGGR